MTVHTFDAASAGRHDIHEWWPTFYRRAFPDYTTHDVVTDVKLQRAGIDHRIHLSGGAEILVDAKCRCEADRWHDDLLVEVWSKRDQRVPGWARKALRCHYIAYAWPQFEVGYVVPFHMLQRAYERNKAAWAELAKSRTDNGFRVVDADNGSYVTRSVAVPVERLRRDVAEAMVVYFYEAGEPFADRPA